MIGARRVQSSVVNSPGTCEEALLSVAVDWLLSRRSYCNAHPSYNGGFTWVIRRLTIMVGVQYDLLWPLSMLARLKVLLEPWRQDER